jgi:pyridoxine 4-dehydrogenase
LASEPGARLSEVARAHNPIPAQVALAWLLHHSPVTLPISGTSSIEHFEENLKAAGWS